MWLMVPLSVIQKSFKFTDKILLFKNTNVTVNYNLRVFLYVYIKWTSFIPSILYKYLKFETVKNVKIKKKTNLKSVLKIKSL